MNVQYTVVGRTREECIDLMDSTGLIVLDKIGGAPWVTIDDDIKRLHNPQASVADDQGFLYQGVRSMSFQGPILNTGTQTYHEGNKPQHSVMDNAD